MWLLTSASVPRAGQARDVTQPCVPPHAKMEAGASGRTGVTAVRAGVGTTAPEKGKQDIFIFKKAACHHLDIRHHLPESSWDHYFKTENYVLFLPPPPGNPKHVL